MNKIQTAYDITAPCVIAPPSPFNPLTQLVSYVQQTAGTAGNLTFNDAATLEEATIANQILTLPYDGTLYVGSPAALLNMPITTGLVVSSVPTGGVFSVQYSIYVPG